MANSGNIIAATLAESGGAFFYAPLGTTVPTDATTPLGSEFTDAGWCGPEGFKNAIKRTTTKHYGFGGENVKTTQDRYEETYTAELLETKAETLTLVHGDEAVTEIDGDMAVEHLPMMLGRKVFVIEFIDGDRVGRHVLREAQVTETADIPYRHDQLTKYGLTMDTYRPEGERAGVVTYYGKKGTAAPVFRAPSTTKAATVPAA